MLKYILGGDSTRNSKQLINKTKLKNKREFI